MFGVYRETRTVFDINMLSGEQHAVSTFCVVFVVDSGVTRLCTINPVFRLLSVQDRVVHKN